MALFKKYGASLLGQPIGLESSRVRQERDHENRGTFQDQSRERRIARRGYRDAMKSKDYKGAQQSLDWLESRGQSLGSGIELAGVRKDMAQSPPGVPSANLGADNLRQRQGLFADMKTAAGKGQDLGAFRTRATALGIGEGGWNRGLTSASQTTPAVQGAPVTTPAGTTPAPTTPAGTTTNGTIPTASNEGGGYVQSGINPKGYPTSINDTPPGVALADTPSSNSSVTKQRYDAKGTGDNLFGLPSNFKLASIGNYMSGRPDQQSPVGARPAPDPVGKIDGRPASAVIDQMNFMQKDAPIPKATVVPQKAGAVNVWDEYDDASAQYQRTLGGEGTAEEHDANKARLLALGPEMTRLGPRPAAPTEGTYKGSDPNILEKNAAAQASYQKTLDPNDAKASVNLFHQANPLDQAKLVADTLKRQSNLFTR